MSSLSTHVLDTSTGLPAAGVRVELRDAAGIRLAEADTDPDGRVKPLGPHLSAGSYQLVFHTAEYFQVHGLDSFYPRVSVEFQVANASHYHVPLLLSPFGYTTYRGS